MKDPEILLLRTFLFQLFNYNEIATQKLEKVRTIHKKMRLSFIKTSLGLLLLMIDTKIATPHFSMENVEYTANIVLNELISSFNMKPL